MRRAVITARISIREPAPRQTMPESISNIAIGIPTSNPPVRVSRRPNHNPLHYDMGACVLVLCGVGAAFVFCDPTYFHARSAFICNWGRIAGAATAIADRPDTVRRVLLSSPYRPGAGSPGDTPRCRKSRNIAILYAPALYRAVFRKGGHPFGRRYKRPEG